MKYRYSYADREFIISPYNTTVERNMLLAASYDNVELDDLMLIVRDFIDGDIKNLNEDEKKLLLYKLRTISVGEEIAMRFKCSCEHVNEYHVPIPVIESKEVNMFYEPMSLELKNMVGTFEEIDKHVSVNLDDCDLDELGDLEEFILDNMIHTDLKIKSACEKCGSSHLVDFGDIDFLKNAMSEDTLTGIYQEINDLVYYSHYNKQDVDNMLPFERLILFELLKSTIKESNQ